MIYPLMDELNALVLEGAVNKAKHPIHPLWIYNYSHQAVPKYGNKWPQALSEARGLVLDESGEIIARAFPKFWDMDINNIRKEPCTITEKMDGSMIIAFGYRGDIVVATRGSFMSEQAMMAYNLITYTYHDHYQFNNHTDVFELVGPGNRIVVNYGGGDKLVYLTSFSPDGHELWHREMVGDAGIEIVKFWEFDTVLDAVNCPETKNREGFVVRWQDGTREKIKFDEYKKLHRVVFGISEWTIWDCLRSGRPLPIDFSHDMDLWVSAKSMDLVFAFGSLTDKISERYDIYMSTHPQTRKDFALLVNGDAHKSAMFLLYNGKMEEYAAYLWKQIEPRKNTLFRKESQYVG